MRSAGDRDEIDHQMALQLETDDDAHSVGDDGSAG